MAARRVTEEGAQRSAKEPADCLQQAFGWARMEAAEAW